ncbi:lytic transglycosylase domain-containing protein [Streptomyces sp. NPDC029554]|uniref:lytic transglycosylase domain-containing protein n=1 Tax=Streptomyces sp. NPDC029554 TaxID=3155126 RepID=UPI003400ADE2
MSTGTSPSAMAAVTAGGCGCLALPVGVGLLTGVLLIVGGLGLLLLPIVIIFMIFNGLSLAGLGGVGNVNEDLTAAEQRCEDAERLLLDSDNPDTDRAERIITGDGRGNLELAPQGGSGSVLEPCTVPEDLYEQIQDAGSICDVIGPVTIAAQIQYESGFDADFVGSNGAKGISQVPPDVFAQLKEDADPTDSDESISAQGEYLCSLADQVQEMVDRQEVTGNVLDMTLAAYDAGIDAVREAKGVPATNDSQSYVLGVRTWFAPMEGVGPPPRKLANVQGLRDDDAASQNGDPNDTPDA